MNYTVYKLHHQASKQWKFNTALHFSYFRMCPDLFIYSFIYFSKKISYTKKILKLKDSI